MSTTDKWSKHAEKALVGQQIPVTRIGFTELENSNINWNEFSLHTPENLSLSNKKSLRPHQQKALDAVIEGFKTSNKGKLIMACGTGKTFTSLKIMERSVPQHKSFVLFLVPSLSLLSQTLTEWKKESDRTIHAFATCSDTKIGRKSDVEEDIQAHDLAIPATTDSEKLVGEVQRAIASADEGAVTVIFSTYQSIQVVKDAQDKGLPAFDLVICDEAHRTTGIGQENKEDSPFIRIHDENFIQAKKRLYMTATPRIYTSDAKKQASNSGIHVYSMDDEGIYGKEFFSLDFSQAVSQELLSDYRVLILAVDEQYVSVKLQEHYADDNNEIPLEDCVKIVGCLNGLAKKIKGEDGVDIKDSKPMQRAVAFTDSIKKSKRIQDLFNNEVEKFFDDRNRSISCEARHVDGSMNALEKGKHLDWLKGNVPENECRILTNARCLSEGIDVPALDAVLFLSPRNSIVDIVQSVGRVMRKSEGKKLGYIILPIAVPANKKPEDALDENKRYESVWKVLQALRAHDKRLDAEINKIDLNEKKDDGLINIIGVSGRKGASTTNDDSTVDDVSYPTDIHLQLPFMEKEWKNAIYAKIVQKCGTRKYWETWASDIADIANKHITLIKKVVQENKQAYKAFSQFLSGLHKNINDSIKEDDAIEMLAQHSITKPVFDAIFEDYSFTRNNPVSKSLDAVMNIIQKDIEGETKSLEQFYEDVRFRVQGIDNIEGKQKVIIELYDKFFRTAFPKTSERLGIVYTPLEVVDFIIHSVEHVLQTEFATSFSNKNVQVLDPFTGTGTFIVRLLQSGLIKNEDFLYKYKNEIFANEIILLAYYIATINIENAYHYQTGKESYIPFNGSVLTDTFNIYEGITEDTSEVMIEELLPENNERLKKQKKSPITVIIGNPPYSAGQKNENDNNRNMKYEKLAKRIEATYVKYSNAQLVRNVHDSYVQAIRWASDRIVKNENKNGIVAFVTNSSFIDGNAMDGLRKCLYNEFSSIYCFNLRGDAYGSGENRRKEGDGIFGEGSRTPAAITILIKKAEKQGQCKLYYNDIGDYLNRKEKLEKIKEYHNISNIDWEKIIPNERGDWINQRDDKEYEQAIILGANNNTVKKKMFVKYSLGVITSRDSWVYNFSKTMLGNNVESMLKVYNAERERYHAMKIEEETIKKLSVSDFIDNDATKISWSRKVKKELERNTIIEYDEQCIRISLYRPFTKSYFYYYKPLNEEIYQQPKLFPQEGIENIAICVAGRGAKEFSVFLTKMLPDYEMVSKGQCFPLYNYEQITEESTLLQGGSDKGVIIDGYKRRENIEDSILKEYKKEYSDEGIRKEDIFYYIYGLLHSKEYTSTYMEYITREIPRIPYVEDFWAWSKAGRALGKLHTEYEDIVPLATLEESCTVENPTEEQAKRIYSVEKMKFAKIGKEIDQSKIIYNNYITIGNIPLEAYKYMVNGKSAIAWIMDRYQITEHKDSKIVNNPNEYSEDPRYIIELLKKVITVSVESVRIIESLPKMVVRGRE